MSRNKNRVIIRNFEGRIFEYPEAADGTPLTAPPREIVGAGSWFEAERSVGQVAGFTLEQERVCRLIRREGFAPLSLVPHIDAPSVAPYCRCVHFRTALKSEFRRRTERNPRYSPSRICRASRFRPCHAFANSPRPPQPSRLEWSVTLAHICALIRPSSPTLPRNKALKHNFTSGAIAGFLPGPAGLRREPAMTIDAVNVALQRLCAMATS